MTLTTWLIIATVVTPFPFAAWVRFLRRPDRDAAGLVRIEQDGGVGATVVDAVDNYVAARLYLAIITAMFVSGGVDAWSYSRVGAGILFLLASYFGVALWLFQSGRIADGAIWVTHKGVHQSHHGFEQGVRWEDIVEISPATTGAILSTDGRMIHRRRAPRVWVGKGPEHLDLGMSLQLGNIHETLRLALVESVAFWASDEAARQEIGTDAATRRLLEARRARGA